MANVISKTIAAATAGTLVFSAKQLLGSIALVSVSGSETAGNNAIRFYNISPTGTMTLLGGAALAGSMSVACSVGSASVEPQMTFTFDNSEDAAVTVSVCGLYTII